MEKKGQGRARVGRSKGRKKKGGGEQGQVRARGCRYKGEGCPKKDGDRWMQGAIKGRDRKRDCIQRDIWDPAGETRL